MSCWILHRRKFFTDQTMMLYCVTLHGSSKLMVKMQLTMPAQAAAGLSQHSDTLNDDNDDDDEWRKKKEKKERRKQREKEKRTEMESIEKVFLGVRSVLFFLLDYMNPSSFLTDLLQSSCLKLWIMFFHL